MTKQEFIKAKVNSFKPEFKQLIGLTKSDRTSELLDFMVMLHHNQDKSAQGNRGEVFGKKGHFVFQIFTKGILRTTVQSGAKRFYPHYLKY